MSIYTDTFTNTFTNTFARPLSSSPSRSEAVARETLACKVRGVLFRNGGLGEVFEKVFVNMIALGVCQRRNLDVH